MGQDYFVPMNRIGGMVHLPFLDRSIQMMERMNGSLHWEGGKRRAGRRQVLLRDCNCAKSKTKVFRVVNVGR